MVEKRDCAMKNRFFTHWQEIDNDAWISVEKRLPTQEDADACNCVISLNKWDEVSIAGWRRFERETIFKAWQCPPEPPANFRELRNNPTGRNEH